MTYTDYFTDSEHRFMAGVTETLIACGMEDDEVFAVAPDILTDWEYADYKEFEYQVSQFDFDSRIDKVINSGTISAKSLKHAKTLLSKKTGVKGRWHHDCPKRVGYPNAFSWFWKAPQLHRDRHHPVLWVREAI